MSEMQTLFTITTDPRHGHYGEIVFDYPDQREGRVRRDDPATSREGAASVAYRAGSQKARLLAAYAEAPNGLTDEEAASAAGLLRSCYWKRAGELRQDGMIAETTETRPGDAGVARIVCRITAAGRQALA